MGFRADRARESISACRDERRPDAAQPSMVDERGLRGARVLERVVDGENGVVTSKAAASPPSLSQSRRSQSPRLVIAALGGYMRNLRINSETPLRDLLPSSRQRNHRRHLDIWCCIAEGVELLRIQNHRGAMRASVEGCGVKSAVFSLHGHDEPTVQAADAAAPLAGAPPHGVKA